jgi:hypothetical protein
MDDFAGDHPQAELTEQFCNRVSGFGSTVYKIFRGEKDFSLLLEGLSKPQG